MRIYNIYSLGDNDIKSIYAYLKQWRFSLFFRLVTNQTSVADIIHKTYEYLDLKEPKIIFSKGVTDAIDLIKQDLLVNIDDVVGCEDYQQLTMNLYFLVFGKNAEKYNLSSFQEKGAAEILAREADFSEYVCYGIYEHLHDIANYMLGKVIEIESSHINNCYLHYRIEQLKLTYNSEAWDILKTLTQECPYLIPLSKFCIVIERPLEICLDNEQLPHAQNKPAMKFGDGTEIYYYHGIPFPTKYGVIVIDYWEPEWILSEETDEYKSVLIYNIGYKRFRHKYPNRDFWEEYDRLLSESVDTIINWQLYHHNRLYLKHPPTDDLQITTNDSRKITDSLPFKLPLELYSLYRYFNGGYELFPHLYFYPFKQAIQALPNLNWIKPDSGYPFPLFKGTREEIYYVLADDPEPTYSHVYCQFPGEEPIVYAECVTSLIVTIAQCYQEGAYYIAIDEETGERSIQQDLDKIEPIFEKFNPDQIDNWRKIWKS